jgi:hypothetical protein
VVQEEVCSLQFKLSIGFNCAILLGKGGWSSGGSGGKGGSAGWSAGGEFTSLADAYTII